MARKHEKFTYSYGWRTAPEQWKFYWMGNPVRLDAGTQSAAASLMICGKEAEAEALLKRELRKQEKENSYACIGFYGKGSRRYYFTRELKCRADSLAEKLSAYKRWKHYIEACGCDLALNTVTSGFLRHDGRMSDGISTQSKDIIDLERPCTVRLVKPAAERAFQF